jgi:TusA-related sulfurtransferase
MAKRRIAALEPGEALVVLATDRESPIDLAAWASDEGHGLVTLDRGGWYEFVLTKCKS